MGIVGKISFMPNKGLNSPSCAEFYETPREFHKFLISPKLFQKTKHRAQIPSRPSINSCFIAGWSLNELISLHTFFSFENETNGNYVKETALVFVITILIFLGGSE